MVVRGYLVELTVKGQPRDEVFCDPCIGVENRDTVAQVSLKVLPIADERVAEGF